MYSNPFVTQLLAEERMKDAMRRNEQSRLIRAVEGFGKLSRGRRPMMLALKNSSTLFNRSPRKQLTEGTPNL